jgi:predicted O-methyltransferase YrrM
MRRLIFAFVANTHSDKPSEELLNHQKKAYGSLGLSYDDAIAKLNRICLSRFGIAYSENNGMWSEHLVFFAALATSQLPFTNILEIGTFKGETTRILADLFPNSTVDSIDLSHDEISRIGTYAYATKDLPKSEEMPDNVKLKTLNSLQLIDETIKYDLVWVDGNHKSPYAQIDISSAIRLIKENGFVLCDDIYLKTSMFEKDSGSESIETIVAFKEAGIIQYSLIRKRLSNKFNNKITGAKFLAVIKKNQGGN